MQSAKKDYAPKLSVVEPEPKLISSPVNMTKADSEEIRVIKRPEPILLEEEPERKEPMSDTQKNEPVFEEQGESKQSEAVNDQLAEFREEVHREVSNLHVELIRQFHIQLVWMQGINCV